jgi:hypothetical protein
MALTDRKVIVVFNEHYGSHSDVPFDLRHKGGGITFRLAPDADNEAIKVSAAALKGSFVRALRPLLLQAKKESSVVEFKETQATYCKAAYLDNGEVLAKSGEAEFNEEITYSYTCLTLVYVRLLPVRALKERLTRDRFKILARSHRCWPEVMPAIGGTTFYRVSIRSERKFGERVSRHC